MIFKMATDDMYLENLDEYINDENKIVTYKWLSRTLEVHVNTAKQMLYTFVQCQRNQKENDDLHVIYCVAGFVERKGVKKLDVRLIHESNLDAVKSCYFQLVSQHIYSVQRLKLQNGSSLYTADYDLQKEHIQTNSTNKYSGIHCMAAKPLALASIPHAATPPRVITETITKSSKVHFEKVSTCMSKPKARMAGMFATAATKKEPIKNEAKTVKTAESVTKKGETPKAKGGVMSFFAKQAAKPQSEKSRKQLPPTEDKLSNSPCQKAEETYEKETEIMEIDKEKDVNVEEEEPKNSNKDDQLESKKREIQIKSKKSQSGRQKKRMKSDEDESQQKRRRIKAMAWSESSSEEEDDSAIDAAPVPSPIHSHSPESSVNDTNLTQSDDSPLRQSVQQCKPGEKARKRVKKMVSKTFVNDEGYMVTEKVYEEHSTDASDEEPIPPTPPVQPKEPSQGKKKSPVQKGSPQKTSNKQMSLTSFFKKK